ncbi:MAG: branched-chain-amino-acid transaminase [Candidatus Bathyarchaeota archaeon]|nr:branched-chain-amino-acid transaminase [Candidatus Bathyarchaeota archaeon]MDH5623209.1 branched-chain-amino-acid transaminase [Candidatus Bathyarchaeota archaeon]MDH5635685.1 branched-chain-amino-acid transaminase [Candidatus Bathyarchaeota archaeon]MDH5701415.1 branched-chain-amino-acid transaminase [Candidatus Bathyarchaeota archaeon]
MEKELLVYIDDQFYPKSEAKISVYDHGLLYGDGVFEGIRAYNGIVFKLKEHIDRLYRSAHTIMLKIPMTKSEMTKAVLETLKKNNLKDAYIRLVVTRGVGNLGLDPRKCPKPTIFIITEPMLQLHSPEVKEKGIKTIIAWVKRDPVDATTHEIKSLNYLNSILGKIEANITGADEAICLNRAGFVCEGVGENIFIVKEGKVFTPPISSGALDGITRTVIMKLAEKLGYEVVERNITPNELFTAEEVFFTGTAAEVTPIRKINERVIGKGKPGPVTKRIMEGFYKLIKDPKEGTPFS